MGKAVRGTVTGRVQGVGFRYFTQAEARQLDLTGWVKNEYDGTVTFFAQGPADRVEQFLVRIKQGPPYGRVSQVRVYDENSDERFDSFEIRF